MTSMMAAVDPVGPAISGSVPALSLVPSIFCGREN